MYHVVIYRIAHAPRQRHRLHIPIQESLHDLRPSHGAAPVPPAARPLSCVTILVLGLGTGAATVVYTIVDSVVLRPLPYRAPDELVKFWDTNTEKGLTHDPFSPVTFMDYKALPVFADAAAWWRPDVNLLDPGLDPVRVKTIEVERQSVLRARRRDPGRTGISRRRPVLLERARRRHQRPPLAHAIQRRSRGHRQAPESATERPIRSWASCRRDSDFPMTSTSGSACGGT